jgi:uncharacterized membrane protein (UPF0127 family)
MNFSCSLFRRTVFFFGVMVVVVPMAFSWYIFDSHRKRSQEISFSNTTYTAEVVDTPSLRALGLGGRANLCSRCAMLFLFEKTERHDFWMNGMQFSLDIIWLLNDTIVFIERSAPPGTERIYRPDVLSNRVLEVNASAAESLHVGDTVRYFPSIVTPTE